MRKEKVKKVIRLIITFLSFLLIILALYIKVEFNDISFNQLLFSLLNSEGTSSSVIINGALVVLPISLILTIGTRLFCSFMNKHLRDDLFLIIKRKGKTKKMHFLKFFKNRSLDITYKRNSSIRKIKVLPFSTNISLIFTVFLFVGMLVLGLKYVNFFEYLEYKSKTSTLFENYYVNPKNVKITFPKQKQNLIYIYVESLEMTSASQTNGGSVSNSYIPKLEDLALNNINFSHNDKLGGAKTNEGSNWTASAIISQTSGVPLKISTSIGNEYGSEQGSMPGVYAIGDVLKDNGYNNYFLMGSGSEFGGRKYYLENHGYTIFDYNNAIEDKKIPSDYKEWWGFEDAKLFEFAKEYLNKLSKEGGPFNLTLLTADTHFIDGYLEKDCETPFDSKYANSFYCADKYIFEFVEWIQKQDFYKNTTIVIVGDHYTMQKKFYNEDSDRSIYNVFINSRVDAKNSKNREFLTMDLYPTTLAALGCKIEGNQLGLGVNLFSDKLTLAEQIGLENLQQQLTMTSTYYNDKILGRTYYDQVEKIEKEELSNNN